MRFKGLDLNLLYALDILLEEQNVTRAAQRMFVGQSAMSAGLARLREHFNDDLLVVSGRRMMPTALAESMRQSLREAIVHIESVVDIDREFVPATSTRNFKVEIPDHLIPLLLPKLTQQLARKAPRIVLDVRPPSRDPTPLLHKGELDLVITPAIYSDSNYLTEPIFLMTKLALVGCSKNPALQSQPSLATVLTLPQVIVQFDRHRLANMLTEEQLELYGGGTRTALVAPNFMCIPACLVGTDRVSLLFRALAELAATNLPIAIWDVPLPMPEMPEVMMFHPMRRNDTGLAWLRRELSAAVEHIA
jgi:LysR family transcriptional regulator, nod-box dependent transcriptional activator